MAGIFIAFFRRRRRVRLWRIVFFRSLQESGKENHPVYPVNPVNFFYK
jgi:hypothetical protein